MAEPHQHQHQHQQQQQQQQQSSSNKMRSSFPLIPPLPSSKVLSTTVDKENVEATPFRSKNKASTMKRTPMSSSRKSISFSSTLPFREATNEPAVSSSNTSTSTHQKKDRVLRTAESMESLFLLSSTSSPDNVQLCQDIVNGTRSDDAAAWWRVLKVACQRVTSIDSEEASSSSTKSDIMRLHRRAKARFSLFDGSVWMKEQDNKKKSATEKHVVSIWLSYAEMQEKFASPEEARSTYRFMQNQYPAVHSMAPFYLSLAKSMKPARAMDILNSGLQKGAEPADELRAALSALNSDSSSIFRTPRVPSNPKSQASPLLHPEQRASALMPKAATVGRKRAAPIISPKRQRKVAQIEKMNDFEPSTNAMDDSNMSTGTVSLSLDNMGDTNKSEQVVKASKPVISTTRDMKPAPEEKRDEAAKPATQVVAPERKAASRVVTDKPRTSRSSLLTKVPRLKSAGLTGGAKRLSPEDNNNALSDSDDDDDGFHFEPVKSKKNDASKALAPKLSKMDLSYMLSWDPSKRGSLSGATGDNSTTLNTVGLVTKTRLGPVVETTEAGSTKGASSVVTATSHATSTASSHTGRSEQSSEDSIKADLREKQSSHDTATKIVRAVMPQDASVLASCNTEFLPLVNENNIIRLNGVPYVKLGMIGKGGSSKVYRALSRNCSVLAIKKVKFGHLDKKAIDGYANEIALLKKLQGNPAIIQMYDSQVDMSRKAIFLAMELGEVDLSQVVQQQALQSSKNGDGKQALNMNFIRLTWQQMLSAVHSIHEERIIHGDLKPANFLFVRGALKLIDFGIAKAIQSDDTTNIYRDSQIGTLNYMSPEAILDTGSGTDGARMRIGRASDIWSLGCILYQMVYGKTPFASLHMIQKLQAITNPAHKIDFPPSTDDAAVDAIRQCLRRNADQRPPIVGKGGLLNEHSFLNYHRTISSS